MRSFISSNGDPTDLVNYAAALSQNTTNENKTLFKTMINDWHKKLLQKYFFNEKTYTIQTIGDQQRYPLPFDYSKLKTGTVTVGNLRWTTTEVLTRQEWDMLNVFPYYADIPSNFYIWNSGFELWPIPSTGSTLITYTGLGGTNNLVSGDTIAEGTNTGKILTVNSTNSTMQVAVTLGSTFSAGSFTTGNGTTGTITTTSITAGNTISFNYQRRVPDLTFTDYVAGTVSATNNNIHITGATTQWLTTFSPTAGDVLFLNLWIRITSPSGDGQWYQIQSINSATTLTLAQPYQGNTVAGASYIIGQMPLILEDFQDALVWQPLMTYFATINPDTNKYNQFKEKHDESIQAMDEYVGTKSLNVNLGQRIRQVNPNLFQDNNIQ